MKIIAFNGSPRQEGNTYQAISMVAEELEKEGIEVEVIQVGNKVLQGCLSCRKCSKNQDERCAIDDEVNGWIQKMKAADGILLGSPVNYASIGATMKCFLDRAFFVSNANRGLFRHKVGAALVAVRRAGGVATFDHLNHYLTYSEMLIATSNYWNVIYGHALGEASQDLEGKQIMRVLGQNMAWLLKLVENGKGSVAEPAKESKISMDFIR
jgi:multimeric flavodoxin WrbA